MGKLKDSWNAFDAMMEPKSPIDDLGELIQREKAFNFRLSAEIKRLADIERLEREIADRQNELASLQDNE